ncbi:hypothetical protein ACFY9G_22065 [Streptomyces anthocyanicus]|uniref:hypothetical protein n=1 Tax=Streptomyces anthocyanicus TaxID=68174 RepID=UPI0036E73CA7
MAVALIEVTGLDKFALERVGGVRSGRIEWTSYFNPSNNRAHQVLSALPGENTQIMYCRGTALGSAAACMTGKQIDYAPTREADGHLKIAVRAESDGFGLEWGNQLTAGVKSLVNSLTEQNATFEGGIGTWATHLNSTVTHSTAVARTGSGSLAIASTSTSNAAASHDTPVAEGIRVTPGHTYLVQAWFRAATISRNVQILVNWHTAAGAYISTSSPTSVPDTTSGWTLSSVSASGPPTAAYAIVIAQVSSPGEAGEVHYVDDVSFWDQGPAYDCGSDQAGNFNAQAYLQVTEFTGVDATVTVQTSTDNGVSDPFSDRISFTVTSAPIVVRKTMTSPSTQLMERYARVVVQTSGGIDSLSFAMMLNVNGMTTRF